MGRLLGKEGKAESRKPNASRLSAFNLRFPVNVQLFTIQMAAVKAFAIDFQELCNEMRRKELSAEFFASDAPKGRKKHGPVGTEKLSFGMERTRFALFAHGESVSPGG